MDLDIRLPIGLMFSLLGLLLGGFGFATSSDQAMYSVSLGLNVNLWWGGFLLIFGAVMLGFALKSRRAP